MTQYSSIFFYRAFGSPIDLGVHKNIYIDGSRQPKNMPENAHHSIDKWFFDKFGVKARSSTIFVCKNQLGANKYAQYSGNTVKRISFPLHAKYIYSLAVEDLFHEIEELEVELGAGYLDNIDSFMQDFSYIMTEDPSTIPEDWTGEIMVYCDTFIINS